MIKYYPCKVLCYIVFKEHLQVFTEYLGFHRVFTEDEKFNNDDRTNLKMIMRGE